MATRKNLPPPPGKFFPVFFAVIRVYIHGNNISIVSLFYVYSLFFFPFPFPLLTRNSLKILTFLICHKERIGQKIYPCLLFSRHFRFTTRNTLLLVFTGMGGCAVNSSGMSSQTSPLHKHTNIQYSLPLTVDIIKF